MYHDRHAGVARLDDALVDELDRADVDAASGLRHEQSELNGGMPMSARLKSIASDGKLPESKALRSMTNTCSLVGSRAAHLREHGIAVRLDRPAVGENLQDHLQIRRLGGDGHAASSGNRYDFRLAPAKPD